MQPPKLRGARAEERLLKEPDGGRDDDGRVPILGSEFRGGGLVFLALRSLFDLEVAVML